MTTQQLKKKAEGFTIIEVLIVLAIAGLILLIVFLAVPALQRTQRNNARNSEAARITALASECLANHNGRPSACMTQGDLGVEADDFRQFNPNAGATININLYNSTTAAIPAAGYNLTDEVALRFGGSCNVDGNLDQNATSRDFAVVYRLEPSVVRCIDSQ